MNDFVAKHQLGTAGSVLNFQDEMAQDRLKMAIFDRFFYRREPPMATFDEPRGEKLAYGMPIICKKNEMICPNPNPNPKLDFLHR